MDLDLVAVVSGTLNSLSDFLKKCKMIVSRIWYTSNSKLVYLNLKSYEFCNPYYMECKIYTDGVEYRPKVTF